MNASLRGLFRLFFHVLILDITIYTHAVYKRLRAVVEGFIGRVKCRLGYGRLTWQGLENVVIHVSLVLMVVYAVAIAAFRIGRPELRQSVAFFS